MTTTTSTNRPIHKLKISPLSAAIWRTETQNGPIFNTTFERTYKTDEGFGKTSSFRSRDLLNLAKLADQAHSYIESLNNAPAESDAE